MAVVLQLLGATAGITALSSAVGGAMLWLRLNALNLPGDESVSVLPKGLLLTVGLHALALPVCFGLLAGLAFVFAKPLDPANGSPRWWRLGSVSALTMIPAIVVVLVGTDGMRWLPERVLVYGAAVLALGAIASTALDKSRAARLAWTVGIGFVLCGSVLIVARTRDNPTLAPIAVISDTGKYTTSGFYIGETTDRLYIAPLPGGGQREYAFADSPADRILVLPRAAIVKMTISEPVGIRPEDPGRDQASTLLADLQTEGVARQPAPAVRTKRPEVTFAPLVNLQAQEDLWPISADDFLAHSALYWARGDGCKPWRVAWQAVRSRRRDSRPSRSRRRRRLPARTRGPEPEVARTTRCPSLPPTITRDRTISRTATHACPAGRASTSTSSDDFRDGTKRARPGGVRRHSSSKRPVYFERHDEHIRGRPATRITYWFFVRP